MAAIADIFDEMLITGTGPYRAASKLGGLLSLNEAICNDDVDTRQVRRQAERKAAKKQRGGGTQSQA